MTISPLSDSVESLGSAFSWSTQHIFFTKTNAVVRPLAFPPHYIMTFTSPAFLASPVRHPLPLSTSHYVSKASTNYSHVTKRPRSPPRMSTNFHSGRREFLRMLAFAPVSVTSSASLLLPLENVQAHTVPSSRPNEVLFDTKVGSYLPPTRLETLLQHGSGTRFNRVIAVGETHTNPRCGNLELDLIRALAHLDDGRRLIVGLECFYRQHNGALHRFVNGDISMGRMLKETDWNRTWGFDAKHYVGIFRFCRRNRIPMVGLNIPSEFVNIVARRGLDGLPNELKKFLPDMDLTNQKHYERFRRVMDSTMSSSHAHLRAALGDEGLSKWYQAQTLWDEYMAESAALQLSADPKARIVIVAGSSHVEERNGIPERVTKRTSEPTFTVVSRSVAWDTRNMPLIDHPEGSGTADWLWYIPREVDLV